MDIRRYSIPKKVLRIKRRAFRLPSLFFMMKLCTIFLSKGISPLTALLALLSMYCTLLTEAEIVAYDFAESELNVVRIDSLALNELFIGKLFYLSQFYCFSLLFRRTITKNSRLVRISLNLYFAKNSVNILFWQPPHRFKPCFSLSSALVLKEYFARLVTWNKLRRQSEKHCSKKG